MINSFVFCIYGLIWFTLINVAIINGCLNDVVDKWFYVIVYLLFSLLYLLWVSLVTSLMYPKGFSCATWNIVMLEYLSTLVMFF